MSTLSNWLAKLEKTATTISVPKRLASFRLVAEKLELLKPNSRVITIGGTNGKGSCTFLLEAIYTAAGYSVGTFTSPHLLRFNERIRINKKEAYDSAIIVAFEIIEAARGDLYVSYFQYSLLAALLLFKQAKVDVMLLEVGIGGRYDAVNTIEPDLSIVASIDYDHCEILGNTLDEIARDKAGIFRKNKPAICGDLNPPKALFEEAKKIGAELFCINRDFSYRNEGGNNWSFMNSEYNFKNLPKPPILLQNAATSIQSVLTLQPILPISENAIRCGLETMEIIGRGQMFVYDNIPVWVNVAHNPAAMKALVGQILAIECRGKRFMVFGICKDKDIDQSISILSQIADFWFVSNLPSPRGEPAEAITKRLSGIAKDLVQSFSKPKDAFHAALQEAETDDMIIVCGSFLIVADILKIMLQSKNHNR